MYHSSQQHQLLLLLPHPCLLAWLWKEPGCAVGIFCAQQAGDGGAVGSGCAQTTLCCWVIPVPAGNSGLGTWE